MISNCHVEKNNVHNSREATVGKAQDFVQICINKHSCVL